MTEKNVRIPLISKEEMEGISNWETKIELVREDEIKKRIYPHETNLETYLEKDLKDKGLSDNTLRAYGFYIEKLLEHAKKAKVDITPIDIKDYMQSIRGKVSEESRYLVRAALKFYFPENFPKIKLEKKSKKIPDILTKNEIKQLINKTENRKHKILIKTLYSTGMRLSEVRNLKWKDILFNEDIIKITWEGAKGKKERFANIALTFKNEFIDYKKEKEYHGSSESWRSHQDNSDYVFSVNGHMMSERGIQYAISTEAKNSGIEKNIHVHSLRHAFATHLLEDGVPIEEIQLLLGHENICTTLIYAHISKKKIKEIRNPLDTLS